LIAVGLIIPTWFPCLLPAQVAPSTPTCSQVNGQCDDLPPKLIDLSYPATPVNAPAENQNPTFTITGTALDPLSGTELSPPVAGGVASGVSYAYIEFVNYPCSGPYPAQTSTAWARLYPQGTFTPGLNQSLSGSLYFDNSAPSGTYYTCYAYISDNLGNSQTYSLFGGSSSPLLAVLPPIQVTGCVVCSAPPPVLQGLSVSPSSADVTNGSGTFTATLAITGAGTGVDIYSSYITLYFVGSSQSYSWGSYSLSPYSLTLLSGDQYNGTYKAQVRIPQHSLPGTWMAYVRVCDNSGNCQTYAPSQLAALGFPSAITIADSNPDTTPPQFKSLSFSEFNSLATTNLVDPEVPITVTLNLSDATTTGAASGLGYDSYSGCTPYMYLVSQNQFPAGSNQSSSQYQYVYFSQAGASSPNATVTWTGTLTFPKLSEIGQWDISIYTCDRVGNYATFTGPATLTAGKAYLYLLYKTQTQPVPATGTIGDPSGAAITIPPGLKPTPDTGGPPVTGAGVSISVTPVPPTAACNQSACTAPGFYNGYKSTNSPFVNYTFSDAAGNPIQHSTFPFPGTSITLPHVVSVPPAVVGGQDQTLTLWSIDNGVSSITMGCKNPATGVYSALNPTVINANGDVLFSNVCSFSTFFVMKKTGVPGDVTGDGAVTCADVTAVKAAFGTKYGQAGYNALADLNNDGVISILDLTFVIKQLAPGTVCH
jgi:hypothetical protein